MKDSHEIHVYAAVSKSMPFILKTFSVTRFSFIFLFLWHSLNNFLVLWVFKDVQFCCLLSLGFSVPSVYLCAGYTFVSFVLLTWPVSRKNILISHGDLVSKASNLLLQVNQEGWGNEKDYRKLEELQQRCLIAERCKDDLQISLRVVQKKIKQLELKWANPFYHQL